ncbi:MAG: MBL fold metallo-hydrolase, partial [Thermoguttaceae bacterium]|nr:MBL fold metallo-hydrolase [Thermoguttaceae bacterium]
MNKRKSLSRRLFLGQCAAAPFVVSQLGNVQTCHAEDAVPEPTPSDSPEIGKPYAGWKEGDLDLHFIYTGRSESCYHIFPDGTSILVDTGDFTGLDPIPALPNNTKRAGEWVARYIKRVNPAGDHVDYMMCSHFHDDHCGGNDNFHAGMTSGRGED